MEISDDFSYILPSFSLLLVDVVLLGSHASNKFCRDGGRGGEGD